MLVIVTLLSTHQNLVELATSYVKQNKPCLDACLHFLVKSLESLTVSGKLAGGVVHEQAV